VTAFATFIQKKVGQPSSQSSRGKLLAVVGDELDLNPHQTA
jgi:hypothetical protein